MSSRSRTRRRPWPAAAGGGSRWSGVSQASGSRVGGVLWRRVALGCVAGWPSPAPCSPRERRPRRLPPVLFPEGATPYLRTHAVGTQNYVCVATGSGLAWRFAGPQATLFVNLAGFQQQATTHFLSPNPDEAGLARATWQGSFDSSRVWARAMQIVDDPGDRRRRQHSLAAPAARRRAAADRPAARSCRRPPGSSGSAPWAASRRRPAAVNPPTWAPSRSCPTAPTMSSFADLRRQRGRGRRGRPARR